MRTVFQLVNNPTPWPIKVQQYASQPQFFRVTYGAQVKNGLEYAAAAHELGECIFHALACNGDIQPHEEENGDLS